MKLKLFLLLFLTGNLAFAQREYSSFFEYPEKELINKNKIRSITQMEYYFLNDTICKSNGRWTYKDFYDKRGNRIKRLYAPRIEYIILENPNESSDDDTITSKIDTTTSDEDVFTYSEPPAPRDSQYTVQDWKTYSHDEFGTVILEKEYSSSDSVRLILAHKFVPTYYPQTRLVSKEDEYCLYDVHPNQCSKGIAMTYYYLYTKKGKIWTKIYTYSEEMYMHYVFNCRYRKNHLEEVMEGGNTVNWTGRNFEYEGDNIIKETVRKSDGYVQIKAAPMKVTAYSYKYDKAGNKIECIEEDLTSGKHKKVLYHQYLYEYY